MQHLTVMEIDWHLLMAEARTVIDRLNTKAAGVYAKYRHTLQVEDTGKFLLVTARQSISGGPDTCHHLAWRKEDGALMKVSVKVRRLKGQRVQQITCKPITAHTWLRPPQPHRSICWKCPG